MCIIANHSLFSIDFCVVEVIINSNSLLGHTCAINGNHSCGILSTSWSVYCTVATVYNTQCLYSVAVLLPVLVLNTFLA